MNRQQIYAMGLRLYHDPGLRIPMTDALEDLGLTWKDWLEESGFLERMADSLIWDCQTETFDEGQSALESAERPYDFVQLCKAFGVPPVKVAVFEICEPDGAILEWRTPTRALALAILKTAACDTNPNFREPEIIKAMRNFHPRASAYRICIEGATLVYAV